MSTPAMLPKDPPGPSAARAIWNIVSNRNARIEPLCDIAAHYGRVAMIRLPHRRLYFVNEPELIQECLVTRNRDFHKDRAYFALTLVLGNGLVTSEDDFHLRQRRMIQPAFHRERVRSYAATMIACALEQRDAWRDGEQIDMNRDMMRLALAIVARTLFSRDAREDTERVGHALDTLMNMDDIFLNPFGPIIAKLPLPLNARRLAAVAELDEVLYRYIAEHRAQGDQGDLLSMLIEARDEDDGGQMTDRQVRDEAVTLFLAGHETTANALTWTWYLLSQHPEIAARMHAELDAVLEGRPPVPDDYPKLEYTRRVFSEAMRLYPPVWAVAREAVCDTQLGPYAIPKGSEVLMSQYVTHRDPRYFPDPERFDPDRWLPEASAGRPKFAYFPFGGGRRLCVGEAFAWCEGVLVLATLGQRWRFEVPDGYVPELDPRITLRPKGGLAMTVRGRA
jgi:cytochrome P450